MTNVNEFKLSSSFYGPILLDLPVPFLGHLWLRLFYAQGGVDRHGAAKSLRQTG